MIRPVHTAARLRAVLVGVGLVGIVSGCTLFHSNIRGGFSCNAPDGTCAPTTVIDDAALKSIRDSAAANLSSGDLVLPSGQSTEAPAPQDVMFPADQVGKDGRLAASLRGRALKIVYPAHRAANGQMVPRYIAYARVDLGDWAGFNNEPTVSEDGKVNPGVTRGLLGAARNAPELLAASGLADQPAPAQRPSAAPASSDWSEEVKSQAARVLNDAKVKTAGTFNPSGK